MNRQRYLIPGLILLISADCRTEGDLIWRLSLKVQPKDGLGLEPSELS